MTEHSKWCSCTNCLLARGARTTEATATQLLATGAVGGAYIDPVDGDIGYRRAGPSVGAREVPVWTLEKARAYSVAAYRVNPMARAIVDTYTSFCVGDSGLTLQCSHPDVKKVAEQFWHDPRTKQSDGPTGELMLRDHLLAGESLYEMMTGPTSARTRWSPIDASRINSVANDQGNPLWPATVYVRMPGADVRELAVINVDDVTGLRTGEALFWPSFKATLTDTRGYPFFGPILDWLDSYDTVLSNLIDRTALARYLVWDVTIKDGDQGDVDEYIANRGGRFAPRSGAVEVHTDDVEWKSMTAQSGSFEDTQTATTVLTQVAGGAGLAKTWLSDPESSNRATSLTMAEPVRRRVGGVQNLWLGYRTEMVRYAIDRAVAAHILPAEVTVSDAGGGQVTVPAAQTVTVTGPEIAIADANITATVLLSVSQALGGMVSANILTPEAATFAAKKAWEDYCGVPYKPELGEPTSNGEPADATQQADTAQAVDDARKGGTLKTVQLATA